MMQFPITRGFTASGEHLWLRHTPAKKPEWLNVEGSAILNWLRPALLAVLMLLTAATHAQEGQKQLAADAWPQLKALSGIEIGKGNAGVVQLLVFFDPNCPHCATLWHQLHGKERGQRIVSALWIPVNYMARDSLGKGAALLSARSFDALDANFTRFDFDRRKGGVVPVEAGPRLQRTLERNTAAWKRLTPATPLLVYRTRDGRVMSQTGLPPMSQLTTLLEGLAPTALERFGQ